MESRLSRGCSAPCGSHPLSGPSGFMAKVAANERAQTELHKHSEFCSVSSANFPGIKQNIWLNFGSKDGREGGEI